MPTGALWRGVPQWEALLIREDSVQTRKERDVRALPIICSHKGESAFRHPYRVCAPTFFQPSRRLRLSWIVRPPRAILKCRAWQIVLENLLNLVERKPNRTSSRRNIPQMARKRRICS